MYPGNCKISVVIIILVAWSLTMSSCTSTALGQEKPNVIYILVDDLGYGDLGCYGQDRIKTPNIDRLAAEGIRFTRHYAGSTVCAPSRAAFMTGLHTGHSVVRGNSEVQPMGQFPLPGTTNTLPKLFKSAGYRTALIGKWGLGGPGSTGHPNLQGFDYFYGYLCQRHAHNFYPEFLFRNDQKVLLDNELPQPKRSDGAGVAIRKEQYSHDLLASEALQYVELNRQHPFFLFLAFTIPHANNEGGDAGMEVPDYGMYAEEEWPEPSKGLAAMISRMDTDVGRLLDKLEALGLADNTLILFSSDNGPHREGGNDPGFFNSSGSLRGIKRDLYEGGIRVPLIARWPGKIAAGRVSDHVSAHWDFFPTICQLTGTEEPELLDGISYLPELLGRQQLRHDYLYWEFHEGGGAQAVRSGNWKAVRNRVFENADGAVELFNLDLDPGEQHDVSSQHPEITRMMEGIMRSAHYEDLNWPFLNR
jgi:arylsulfatase A-like enzyme